MNQPLKPSPLGRGLSALFGDTDASYQAPPKPAERLGTGDPHVGKTGVMKLPLAWVQPGNFQPRRIFDEEALQGLAESIRERGILEPILVRPIKGHQEFYEIIAGERRWRAAQLAALHEVPAMIRELSDREALEFGLIENIQRQDLSPLEEAEGYQRLMAEFAHSPEALSKIVGKSRPHISNMLRLLNLPVPVKQMIDKGDLSMGHARAIITAPDPLALAQEIVKKGLSVRQTEALAKRVSAKPDRAKTKDVTLSTPSADTLALEKEIERLIGLRVKIHAYGKTGSITVHYDNLDQLDGIIKKLKG